MISLLTSPNCRGANLAGTDLGAIRGSASGKPAAAQMRMHPSTSCASSPPPFLHCAFARCPAIARASHATLRSGDIIPQVHFGHVARTRANEMPHLPWPRIEFRSFAVTCRIIYMIDHRKRFQRPKTRTLTRVLCWLGGLRSLPARALRPTRRCSADAASAMPQCSAESTRFRRDEGGAEFTAHSERVLFVEQAKQPSLRPWQAPWVHRLALPWQHGEKRWRWSAGV